jgi:hypothetical protein
VGAGAEVAGWSLLNKLRPEIAKLTVKPNSERFFINILLRIAIKINSLLIVD